jgi:hypothetical protein
VPSTRIATFHPREEIPAPPPPAAESVAPTGEETIPGSSRTGNWPPSVSVRGYRGSPHGAGGAQLT